MPFDLDVGSILEESISSDGTGVWCTPFFVHFFVFVVGTEGGLGGGVDAKCMVFVSLQSPPPQFPAATSRVTTIRTESERLDFLISALETRRRKIRRKCARLELKLQTSLGPELNKVTRFEMDSFFFWVGCVFIRGHSQRCV